MKSASCVFVTSYDYAEHSRLLKPLMQKSREKLIELPCSVDTKKESVPRAHPDEPLTPYILFVGALDSAHYSKGVPVLLEAVKLVSGPNFNATIPKEGNHQKQKFGLGTNFTNFINLVIIGDGDLRKKYEQMAKTLGITESVRFVGSVSHDELTQWYSGALCLVLPSTDSTEAFGVVIIEAAANGIPAVATCLPGVRSVIEDGATGFLIEPNNAEALAEKIAFFVSHPEYAAAMGAAARKRAEERYSYDAVGKKYVQTIRAT